MTKAGIDVAALRPANAGVLVNWSDIFRDRFEGRPLKRIALSLAGQSVRGEAVVTRSGLEGGGIYALSVPIRDAIDALGEAMLHIDLRPDVTTLALAKKLAVPREKQSLSTFLRKAGSLSPVAIGLLQESQAGKLSALVPEAMAALIKQAPVRLIGVADIAKAISSAGGISFDAIDAHYMLHKKPGTFVAGEMLDWEAPTGGYLLQACFATGVAAGEGALAWLQQH